MRSAFETWEAALGELQIQVSKPNFDTWLKDTKGMSLLDGIFVVGVPNAFVGEWLNGRLRSLIIKTLSGIVGKPMDVRFEANTPAPPPPKESVLADGGVSVLERPAVVLPARREPAPIEAASLNNDSRPDGNDQAWFDLGKIWKFPDLHQILSINFRDYSFFNLLF